MSATFFVVEAKVIAENGVRLEFDDCRITMLNETTVFSGEAELEVYAENAQAAAQIVFDAGGTVDRTADVFVRNYMGWPFGFHGIDADSGKAVRFESGRR